MNQRKSDAQVRRRDFFGQDLSVGDEVVFAYINRKLSSAKVFDLHVSHSLPLVTIESLDGTQRATMIAEDMVKVDRE